MAPKGERKPRRRAVCAVCGVPVRPTVRLCGMGMYYVHRTDGSDICGGVRNVIMAYPPEEASDG